MIGTSIGPYRVIERLGSGGMGEVFLAEDARLRRRVALKRLSAGALRGSEGRARILREARAAARLHHPGIATIFDVVEDADAVCIVMEYVEGETLAARLKKGPLPLDQTLDLAIQIADAVADAHAHGVLHCDLKPLNVHLTPAGRAKILDFGLAQLSAVAVASEETRVSSIEGALESAGISGSPGYMAPERLSGAAPDERADVYAMGVMMFEMLTGRRPFTGTSLMSAAVEALTTPPPSPSSLDAAIPATVSAVVVKALSREPGTRFQSAQELAGALRTIASGTTRHRTRRTTWLLAATGVVVLAGATVAITGWRPWRGPRSPADRAAAPTIVIKPFANLGRDALNDPLGVGITDELTAKLAELPTVAVVSRATTAAYLVNNPKPATIARDLGASFVVDGGFERTGDQLRVTISLLSQSGAAVWTRTFERPLPQLFALQRELAEGVAKGLDLTLTSTDRSRLAAESTRNVDALADYSQGRQFLDRRDARGNIDHAIEAFDRAIAKDPGFALAHAGRAAAYWDKYVLTKDAAWTTRAITASLEALRLNPNLAEVHVALGTIYAGLGQATTAIEELGKALALQPNNDDARRALGDVFAKAGRTDEAVREYQQAIAIRPNYWQNHNRLAVTLMKVGRYTEAEAAYRRIAELQPDSAVGFNNLGVVAMLQDDLTLGLASLSRAAEIAPRPSTYSNIGTIHFWSGRFGDARSAYLKAIELDAGDASLQRNLGDALVGLKDPAAAKAAYGRALDLAMNQWKVNPHDATTLSLVGLLEAKLGRAKDARVHIDQAFTLAPKDPEVYYRGAAVAALAGERARALADLKKAVAAGYSLKLMKRDLDLLTLRDEPEYLALTRSPS